MTTALPAERPGLAPRLDNPDTQQARLRAAFNDPIMLAAIARNLFEALDTIGIRKRMRAASAISHISKLVKDAENTETAEQNISDYLASIRTGDQPIPRIIELILKVISPNPHLSAA